MSRAVGTPQRFQQSKNAAPKGGSRVGSFSISAGGGGSGRSYHRDAKGRFA
jgi:hypothetical protein